MAETENEEAVEKGGSKKKLIIIVGGVLAVLLIAGAGLFFTGFFDDPAPVEQSEVTEGSEESADSADSDAGSESTEALYQELKPPFIVNFQGSNIKIIKIAISVMTHNADVLDAVKQHDPVIRNNTLLILASQNPEELKTTEGKLVLQGLIKDGVNKVLATQKISGSIEQVFFTDLVMQ